MLSPAVVKQQIDRLGVGPMYLCKPELRELPHLMIAGEEIEHMMAGRYLAGYSIIVATNYRLLIINKTVFGGLVFEDIPYDMIAEVEFTHTIFNSHLIVFARSKKIEFVAFQGTPVRDFAMYLEQRMMEARNQISTMRSPFPTSDQTPQYSKEQPKPVSPGLYAP
jgi:hypothetical protein